MATYKRTNIQQLRGAPLIVKKHIVVYSTHTHFFRIWLPRISTQIHTGLCHIYNHNIISIAIVERRKCRRIFEGCYYCRDTKDRKLHYLVCCCCCRSLFLILILILCNFYFSLFWILDTENECDCR